MRDPLLGSGLILVQVPERIRVNETELSVECNSSLLTGTRIKQFPSVRYVVSQEVMTSASGNTSLTCLSVGGCLLISSILSNASLELPLQSITLKISGLRNIDYVTDIGTAMVRTFYDSEWDSKVA